MESFSFSEILKLFPFAIHCDVTGVVVERGPAWQKFGLEAGDYCSEVFQIEITGGQFVKLQHLEDLHFERAVTLKSELVPTPFKALAKRTPDKIILLMTPSLGVHQDLSAIQLSFEDFSPLDPAFDYLLLVQSHKSAAQEMKTLYEQNQLLARLPEETPFPILRLNQVGEIMYTNKAFQNLFKESGNILSFFKICRELVKEKQENGFAGPSETLTRTLGDRHFSLTVVPIQEYGYFNIFASETTNEIRALQDVQDERGRTIMAAKLSTLGEMAAGIAHEINNPLAIIKGRVQIMNRAIEGADPVVAEKVLKNIVIIDNTIERISKIVVGLKNFSRDASHDKFENIFISQLVKNVWDLVEEKFTKYGVSFKTDISEDLKMEGQTIQMEQVLLNLITNSFHAIENLEEKWIQVSSFIVGSRLQIRIEDSGPGIPAELREKIMLPFFTTKPTGKGTGLGLSISKGIVEKHFGRIFIDELRPNTCFVIELPQKISEELKETA